MNEVVLRVEPAAVGWWVGCDLPLEPTYFRSGARAEAVARSLAISLRRAGRDVRLVVSDKADATVRNQRYLGFDVSWQMTLVVGRRSTE